MDHIRAKKAIYNLIILHQQVLSDGGTYAFSDQYRQFIIQKKTVLRLFSLPETDENLFVLFDYPLTHAYYYTQPINERMCRIKTKIIIKWFGRDVLNGKPWARMACKMWKVNEQVEYVYINMVRRAIEHLKS